MEKNNFFLVLCDRSERHESRFKKKCEECCKNNSLSLYVVNFCMYEA